MSSLPNNPVGRLCFRCGVALSGPAAVDTRGRVVCPACAAKGATQRQAEPEQAELDPRDERVQIDLGGEALAPIAARSRPDQAAPRSNGETAVDLVNPTPTPKRLAPAKPVPELEDMSKYAPANQYRPKVPSTDSGGDIPERKCAKCGYSLEGLETNRCPECGHLNERHRGARGKILAEESRRIEREEYLKPTIVLGIGLVIVCAILAIGGEWGTMAMQVGGLPIRVVFGTVAYFLCCLWFFGFDAPWRLTALRLAATYAISDIPFAAVHILHFPAAMSMAYLAALVISMFMFIWLFDLDPADAWLLVAVSAVVNVVLGLVIAVVVDLAL